MVQLTYGVGTDFALFRFLFAQKSVTRCVVPPFSQKVFDFSGALCPLHRLIKLCKRRPASTAGHRRCHVRRAGVGILQIIPYNYILTLVCLSPALLRSPDLPERMAGE